MAIVAGSKFLSIPESTDTIERGSVVSNSKQQYYTIEDIVAEAVADGNLGVTGDLSVSGDLTVTGDGSTTDLTVTGAATVGSLAISAFGTAPAQNAVGTTGQIIIANDGIYVCIASGNWFKTTLATY